MAARGAPTGPAGVGASGPRGGAGGIGVPLDVADARISYGELEVVRGVSLRIPAGGRLALLGPSGCGKSTLLRAIAGLEPLTAGTVRMDGRDLAGVPTYKRGIGLMFQDNALFPHLDVAGNVGYGPKIAGWSKADIATRVDEVLVAVGLGGRGSEPVSALSGGEQQRVALARTLAPRPSVVMLDEPLGSLDRALREELVGTLVAIAEAEGATVLYVTHDHAEAFTIGDEVAVMREGRVVQQAAPEHLWAAPATAWVARFLGLTNVLSGEQAVALGVAPGGAPASRPGGEVLLRPELLELAPVQPVAAAGGAAATVGVPVTVSSVAFRGEAFLTTVQVEGSSATSGRSEQANRPVVKGPADSRAGVMPALVVRSISEPGVRAGDSAILRVSPAAITSLGADTD